MQIEDLVFIGYSVTDMKRARAFYEGTLGLKKARGFGEHQGEDQWVEYDVGSGCLCLFAGATQAWPPGGSTAAALEVKDFQASLAELKTAGVKFVGEPFESPICWMLAVNDPDGNRVVIHQRKRA